MKRICNILAHLRQVGHQFGPLCDDCRVNVLDHIVVLIQKLCDLPQQLQTGNAFIGRILVRKMLSDVPKRCRAEQSVHDRMEDHIRIGVSKKSLLIRDLYPAKDQFSSLDKPVHIITGSDSPL